MGSIVAFLLKKVSINLGDLTSKLDVLMDTYPKVYGSNSGSHLSKDASQAIQAAQSLSKDFGDEFVAMDMILAGILTLDQDPTAKLLRNLGATSKDLGSAIKE